MAQILGTLSTGDVVRELSAVKAGSNIPLVGAPQTDAGGKTPTRRQISKFLVYTSKRKESQVNYPILSIYPITV